MSAFFVGPFSPLAHKTFICNNCGFKW